MIVSNDPVLPHPETVQFLDHRSVIWDDVQRSRYLIHQYFRYDYPGAVSELRQRLVVVPADTHGPQRLRDYRLEISAQPVTTHIELDSFGNRVFRCHIPQVESSVDFEVWVIVERGTHPGAPSVPAHAAMLYLAPTALTSADATLAAVARTLTKQSSSRLDLAERINTWTYEALRYRWGVTHVGTTAAQALALGQGVCQDYAHIMLAICRAAGMPARYVSGHLLGEGASHAWVEVLLPDSYGNLAALAFDPTNHCRAGMRYITIAVGRDYQDVSPTSGTYTAPFQGRLTTRKRAGVTAVEYDSSTTI